MDSYCEKIDSTEVEDLCENFIKNMKKMEIECLNNEKQQKNDKTIQDNTLILINSKKLLIDLVDKEINKYSKKNESGDSNQNHKNEKLKRQKRLINIANIRREVENLENFLLTISNKK